MKKLFCTFLILLSGLVLFSLLPTKPLNEDLLLISQQLKRFSSEFQNSKYSILIDYDKPFFRKRLWVIQNSTKEVILNCHVSHAWKSGFFVPTQFSNIPESKISCKGVFKTLYAYESNYGHGDLKIGMRINGLEKQNNNALKRNIVFHSSYGPWSSGCFMTFPTVNKQIIDFTKNGSMVIVR